MSNDWDILSYQESEINAMLRRERDEDEDEMYEEEN